MKTDRQELILKILKSGRYKVTESGELLSLRKGEWVKRQPATLKHGKLQYLISGYKTVYAHDLVWLAHKGKYPTHLKIVPRDGNWSNPSLNNLKTELRRKND